LGESVFLDATVPVYPFAGHAAFGTACTQLLQRIEHQNLLGFTSTRVRGELAHRLIWTGSAIMGMFLPGRGSYDSSSGHSGRREH
jgi:hypothetical protein